MRPRVGQHRPQDLLHLVELRLADDQWRRELDDGVATVVRAAVEPGLVQRLGEKAAQEALGLIRVERLAGGFVLDEFDPVELAGPADVADDREVQQLLQRRAERSGVGLHMIVESLALEDVEVGHRNGR